MKSSDHFQAIDSVLKKILIPKDEYIFGYADLDNIKHKVPLGYRYGISIARKLDDSIVNKLLIEPTVEYYKHYHIINSELLKIAYKLQEELKSYYIESLLIEPTVALSSVENKKYLKTLTVPTSHKMIATRAGLGWIGKTGLLINPEFGPRLRLISILIKEYLDIKTNPVDESLCGECMLCVENCPATAANGKPWNINVKREEFFDAFLCREECRKRAALLNLDIKLCGLCVAICPHGRRQLKMKQ